MRSKDEEALKDIAANIGLIRGMGSKLSIAQFKPRVKAFLQRIHARPAYQRALQRGGPYSYA